MFIFTGMFYKEYLHAIDDVKEETVKIELKIGNLENEKIGILGILGSSIDNLE